MIIYSVIIPHYSKSDTRSLERVVGTIPIRSDIEIIVVDNSPISINPNLFANRNSQVNILYSDNSLGAGGARNMGIDNAKGKWLIFADSDDLFSNDAFSVFDKNMSSDSDVIFFSVDGRYNDNLEHNNAGDYYTQLVRNYIDNPEDDIDIRISYHTPWAKMVNRKFVVENGYRFDEVKANNDDYFSMMIGFYARKISAVDVIVYTYVTTQGSIMQKKDYESIKSRFLVVLRKNLFLRENRLRDKQGSIALFLLYSLRYGLHRFWEFVVLLIKFKQNPFIGFPNWGKTFFNLYTKNR